MPTNLTKLIFYFILTLSPLTWASEPSGAPILRIETEMHTDRITQISVDAKESFLLTASDDKTLRLWDLNDGKQKQPVYRVPIGAGYEGKLYAAAISPDGELIIGGGWTGNEWEQSNSIYIFNRFTGKLVKRLYGLKNVINHLCFSPDGQYLAAILGGFGIRVWETQRWEQIFSGADYGGPSNHCVFDVQNRLLTSADDDYLRLYSPSAGTFALVTQWLIPYRQRPMGVAFSPTGDKIAVGFWNSKQVYVLNGQTLSYLFATDTKDISPYAQFVSIAWSPDGQRLCVAGSYNDGSITNLNDLIRCWPEEGRGTHIGDWPASKGVISNLHFLKNGDLVYATQSPPSWGILDSNGQKRLEKRSALADYHGITLQTGSEVEVKLSTLLLSQDGSIVQFELEQGGGRPARFSLMEPKLILNPPVDNTLLPPDTTSLNITGWGTYDLPKLNGVPLSFPPVGEATPETGSLSLAIAPNKSVFLLGTNGVTLRLFDTQGSQKLAVTVPGRPEAVNFSGDQEKVVAALDDGTIRWYNADGEELLAFFPHNDGQRWIAWTPSGYYMSSGEDADNLLGWHVNHGRDQAASFYPVGQLYSKTYKRPEVVQRTLVELGETEALQKLQAENTPNEPSTKPILRIEAEMHTARINRFDIYESVTEHLLVTASHDKTLRLWELADGKQKTIYRVPIETGDEGKLYSTAISPDGQWIATAGDTGRAWEEKYSVYVFSRATGQLVKRLTGLPEGVHHLCFSPDGQYLAVSMETGLQVWETKQWQQVFSDTEYGDTSQSCQFDSKNRLLTSAWDGYLRLYSLTATGNFALLTKTQPPGGKKPFHAVFSPKGDKIAVGFDDSTQVNVLDGQTLDLLYSPDTNNVDNGNFISVAWSPDEQRLCAGGKHDDKKGNYLIRCWSQGGQVIPSDWIASNNTIIQLRFLQNGDLVYGTGNPSWGILDSEGQKKQEHVAPIADYRTTGRGENNLPEQDPETFRVSYDGSVVQFGFEQGGSHPARFSLNQQLLLLYPSPDSSLQLADTTSLNITDWRQNFHPKLNGTVLPFFEDFFDEVSRSLAIAPDQSSFLLGTENFLVLFDVKGKPLWGVPLSSVAWAVNISGDGQKAIAALGDGTIRWYNLATGEELLAFFPHTDGKRWIAWTPSGYYMSSGENADKLLGWHFNQKSKDQEAKFYSINALQTAYQEMSNVANGQPNPEINKKRPDIVKKVLETLTEDKAILVANLEQGIDAGQKKSRDEQLELIGKKFNVNSTLSGLGKAIIVAASGPQANKNTLFPYTNEFTERMYNLLHDRGFSDGDVIYINPYPPAVPPNNSAYEQPERQDFPLRDPLNELTQSFDDAARELKSGQQFIFYLHGHAEYQKIRLRLGQESEPSVDLSAQQLKEQLAKIPKGVTQIIILDTCHSGSFLAELAGVPDRIVVTSTDSDSLAWTFDKGISFAYMFISLLESNNSIAEAFKNARKTIRCEPLFGNQSPQLDDNQDSQYVNGKDVILCKIKIKNQDGQEVEVEVKDGQLACGKLDVNQDGQLACNTYIGGNKVSASVPPVITEVHPAIYLDPQETTATLWVKTSVDLNTVNKVQAILTNENDKPTEYQGEQTQFTRRDITLTPNYELQRFEADYNGFQAAKEWRIFYQVETIEGQRSDFEVGFVRTDTDQTSVTVEAIVNQPAYQVGDPFRFEVMVAGEGNFDLYVGFLFPHGDYATIGYPFSFSAVNELLPYQKNLTLAKEGQTFTILNFGLGLPAIELGEYQACVLLTKANSDPNENSNWVKLDCEGFRF